MPINKNFKVETFKFPKSKIIGITNFLNKKFYKLVLKEILKLERSSKNIKSFIIKNKSSKKEFLDFSEYYPNQKKIIEILSSNSFKKFLKKKLQLNCNIYSDRSKMYSGFNIFEKDGFLKGHADFNYNSKLKKYRTINLLIYFNTKWKLEYGGNLIFYNYKNNKKKYEFIAKGNSALIFLTNKYTLHGYKKIKTNKKRLSLNFYYYTSKNLSFSKNPHRTIWM